MSPEMQFVLDYWPMVVFLPVLLVLFALLAVITRLTDRKGRPRR